MNSEQAISRLVERIATGFHPERVILFGSRDRGTARPDSDADVPVLVDQQDGLGELMTEMYRAIAGIGMPVDLVVMPVSEFERLKPYVGTVARPAAREGRVLYQRVA